MEELLPSIPSNPGLKRDEDQHQNMQDQDMDMGNQDTDTGPLGLGEVGRKRDTRGLGSEGIGIQETTIMTWAYCDQDVGVQDTDVGDWDLDARELSLKQVTGTRTGACRDTGDQDQQRDTARPEHGQVHGEMGMGTQEAWISTWRTRIQGIRTGT